MSDWERDIVDRYRRREISRGAVAKLLGLSLPKTEELLAKHQCYRQYGLEELEEDRKTLRELFGET